ncbi:MULTISPECIES: phosphate ABC transporter substrate-binding protein PstS [Methylosinus]|uniref:Phosphate-binding protein PstS n=1 Tax=Methylosinus trichosporium (strain ATCC 35070 / NCIMB 11131 / UNIQEM 75 / OB3b) TaxID=595536 RepID=A0A2D2CY15_METT3|nr:MULTISPECIES: phosphate ABC transporter substrate-binding protein PstS [Methylosinus]ATQ67623.1 phosphate ABC transporter substrate-binding protein PstS [Methylosinus trichosporium OB3b]OBS52163.1 phosphate ABC transporter substrate-binding protein PstS [Methylosinus sp. 3S-1]
MHIYGFARGATLAAAVLVAAPALAYDISGAGATFPLPVYARWAQSYSKETGDRVNYQSIGSGGGIRQVKARTVTFGASDQPLTAAELEAAGLIQWPQVAGGVVAIVNLDGLKAGDLVLDGPTLARIYLGEIARWDDAAIAALNPKSKLPAQPIVVVHRSDGSGTTFCFTDYLSHASAKWKETVGENVAVDWPLGMGAKGNEGVANNVATAKGAIGYVEFAYAKQSGSTVVHMVNHDGRVVAPSKESFRAAADNADWAHAPGFFRLLTDQPGAQSWPIAAATFILLPKTPKDAEAARVALKFFDWAFVKGGAAAEELDYEPMPSSVIALIRKSWSENLKDAEGKPLVR